MTAHPIDFEALRRLADAATEGPWERTGRNGIHTPIGSCIALTHRHDPEQRQDDAEFIAAARTALPTLLDLLAAAQHRATRMGAQSAIRGRAVQIYQRRARKAEAMEKLAKENWRLYHRDWERAEARIKAVEDVLSRHESIVGDSLGVPTERIRRALEGEG